MYGTVVKNGISVTLGIFAIIPLASLAVNVSTRVVIAKLKVGVSVIGFVPSPPESAYPRTSLFPIQREKKVGFVATASSKTEAVSELDIMAK